MLGWVFNIKMKAPKIMHMLDHSFWLVVFISQYLLEHKWSSCQPFANELDLRVPTTF